MAKTSVIVWHNHASVHHLKLPFANLGDGTNERWLLFVLHHQSGQGKSGGVLWRNGATKLPMFLSKNFAIVNSAESNKLACFVIVTIVNSV